MSQPEKRARVQGSDVSNGTGNVTIAELSLMSGRYKDMEADLRVPMMQVLGSLHSTNDTGQLAKLASETAAVVDAFKSKLEARCAAIDGEKARIEEEIADMERRISEHRATLAAKAAKQAAMKQDMAAAERCVPADAGKAALLASTREAVSACNELNAQVHKLIERLGQ